MAYLLEGQIIAVTGGSGGIGGAICRKLDAEGATCMILDTDEAGGTVLRAELNNPQSCFMKLDVSDSAAVAAAFEQIEYDYGRIDGLVNAAGVAPLASCLETDDKLWHHTLSINLSGVYYCSRQAARMMAKRGEGVIVNISSTNGLVGEEMLLAYNATKFGVMGITKTMAAELGEKGIRVNAVNPGLIETKLISQSMSQPGFVEAYCKRIPLRRLGQPEEVASCVAFLLSKESSFVTGIALVIDGGQICH